MLEFTHMHFGDMDSHLPYLLLLLLRKMPLLLRLRPEKSVRLRLNLRLTPTICTTILSPTLTLLSTLLSRKLWKPHQLSPMHLTLLFTILTHMDTLAMDTHMLTIHMLLPNQLRLLKNPQLSLREKGVKLKLILQFLPFPPRSTTHCLQSTPFHLLTPMESTLVYHLPELEYMHMDIHMDIMENN